MESKVIPEALTKGYVPIVMKGGSNATMQNIFRELDIFSFSLSEDFIPITDSGTSDHFR